MKVSQEAALLGVAALAAVGLVWWASKPGAAGKIAAAGVGMVGDAAVGTVKGIGTLVGIPDTNLTQCDKDLANSAWWDASFSCPAGTYLGAAGGAVFGSTSLSASEAADARRDFARNDPRRLDLQTDTGTSWDNTPGIY